MVSHGGRGESVSVRVGGGVGVLGLRGHVVWGKAPPHQRWWWVGGGPVVGGVVVDVAQRACYGSGWAAASRVAFAEPTMAARQLCMAVLEVMGWLWKAR